MAEWVSLRHILDVCASDTYNEVEGKLRVSWWRQVASEKQMKFTVEEILVAARVQW